MDGTKFYILGRGTLNVIEYNLTNPWDIETASYVHELDISPEMGTAVQESAAPHGLYIKKETGDMLWIFNRTEIWEYTLSTDWDISTATQTGYRDLSTHITRGHDIDFKPDGSILYVDDRIAETVSQFNLNTGWDIETTDLDYVYDISAKQEAVRGIQFSPDGSRMFLMDTERQDVLEYHLTTPYDLRSSTFAGEFNVGTEANNPRQVTFNDEFTQFYITDASENTIYQYNGPYPSFQVSYSGDWNLAGVPIETTGIIYSDLYSTATQEPFIFESNSYNFESTLTNSIGYWVHLSEEETTRFFGLPNESIDLSLDEGWNLVSGIGSSLSVSSIDDPQNLLISNWYGFDGSYFSASTLEPGNGYWIKANQAGSITLQKQAGKQFINSPIASYEPAKEFNAMHFFSGKSDTLQTLYFGSELPNDIEQNWYTMPPTPPVGSFDARFTGEQTMLTEHTKASVELQVPENRAIQIKIESSKRDLFDSWKITQLIDGVPYREDELIDGQSIDLYSSEINELRLEYIESGLPQESETPISYSLKQNFPNPFNPTTQISYQIPQQQFVKLEVFDLLGRRVSQLVNENQPAGNYTVIFDASNLTSGVYIYRLQAGSYSKVRRLLLVK